MKKQRPKTASPPGATGSPPGRATVEEIARRAYEIYLARGREPGHEEEDWLRAEKELREEGATRK
jgi:hypothetical protein